MMKIFLAFFISCLSALSFAATSPEQLGLIIANNTDEKFIFERTVSYGDRKSTRVYTVAPREIKAEESLPVIAHQAVPRMEAKLIIATNPGMQKVYNETTLNCNVDGKCEWIKNETRAESKCSFTTSMSGDEARITITDCSKK